MSQPPEVKVCNVGVLEKRLKEGACQVVDVREASELEEESIAGCLHVPLSSFSKNVRTIDRARPVFLICRSGNRARDAAARLVQMGFSDVTVAVGGMREWIKAGYPVVRGQSVVWDLERQVRFAAGLLVLLGIGLAHFFHPYYIFLSVFVGAGLAFSGLTNTCSMAMLLAKMPWNQRSKSAS